MLSAHLTCDHPVCLNWSDVSNRGLPLGLLTRGTEIMFPVSPALALIGTHELRDQKDGTFTEEQVASANGAIIKTARRQVYALNDDFKYRFDEKEAPHQGSDLIADQRFAPRE